MNMLKKVVGKINKLEQEKQIKINKQNELQAEIYDIDVKLKKLNSFKKEFEKLQTNSTEFLNNM